MSNTLSPISPSVLLLGFLPTLVAVGAQGAAELVRVHRALGQVREDREREQVADLSFSHGDEYTGMNS